MGMMVQKKTKRQRRIPVSATIRGLLNKRSLDVTKNRKLRQLQEFGLLPHQLMPEVPEKEKEYWKQENGANGLWHKNGIYHLGDEETKGQTIAKAMLKSDLLTAGKIWNYWGDEKWHKNTGVVIKCGC